MSGSYAAPPVASGFWDSLRDGFYTVDQDWRFTYFNRAARRSIPQAAELQGESLWASFPHLADSDAGRALRRAVAERRQLRFDAHSRVLGHLINVGLRPHARGLAVSFRETPRPGTVRGRILVVDDQPEIREMMQMLLEDEGYLVTIADDFDAAQAAIEMLPMDCMILDDRLPGGRGSSLHDRARDHGLRVLVTSGHPTSIEQFHASPAFLAKPFRPSELLPRLKRILASPMAAAVGA